MFVSVVDFGPQHMILDDDGTGYMPDQDTAPVVYPNRFSAMAALRELYLGRAQAHGLELDGGDLSYVHDLNGFTVDGMDPDEWIVLHCGCDEDGGTLEKCAS